MTDTTPAITDEEFMLLPQRYEVVPIDRPKPHPENPKLHDDEAITESIKRNGFFGAIYMQEGTDFILAGHGRWENAKAMGAAEIPALIVECDEATARRILLADNIGWKAGFDDERLANILGDLASTDELFGTGYDADDVDDLLSRIGDQYTTPQDFQGGYVENPDEARTRAERKATTKDSLGLREVVLVYNDDDYERLKSAVGIVESFHSAGSTSEAILAGMVNYAKQIASEDEG